jgi:sugar lactone lactonase YvrE
VVLQFQRVIPGNGFTLTLTLERRIGEQTDQLATYTKSNVHLASGGNTVRLDELQAGSLPENPLVPPTLGSYVKTIGLGGSAARFQGPGSMVVTNSGEVFVLDQFSIRRLVSDASGKPSVSTLAGDLRLAGFSDGVGTAARFRSLSGVTLGPDGSLFVTDGTRVRHVSRKPDGSAVVATVAGRATSGFRDGTSSEAEFAWVSSIAMGHDGNLYVLDIGNQNIRVITWDHTGAPSVSTLAGTHGNLPIEPSMQAHLVTDPDGGLILATETRVQRVRWNEQGIPSLHPVAGSTAGFTDGPGDVAKFREITSVTVDANKNIYVADSGNRRIRRIATTPGGQVNVTTAADSGASVNADGEPASLVLSRASGLGFLPDGRLLVSDGPMLRQLSGLSASQPRLSPYAGRWDNQDVPQNGPGIADLNLNPSNMAVNADGRIYLAEGNRIWSVNSNELGHTELAPVAGALEAGYSDGLGTLARFRRPTTMAFDRQGHLLVFDSGNSRIRRLAFQGDGVHVETLAGSGTVGTSDGPALVAGLHLVKGFAVTPTNDIYFTDYFRVRKLTFNSTGQGTVTTLAGVPALEGIAYLDGPGEVARFGHLGGIAVGEDGEVFVADQTHHVIRKLAVGTADDVQVSTYAGGGGTLGTGQSLSFSDGRALEAAFYIPSDILSMPDGALYVADQANHRIRRIAKDGVNVWVSTLGGNAPGLIDGPLSQARFFYPRGLACDGQGNMYVLEGNFVSQVRKVVM